METVQWYLKEIDPDRIPQLITGEIPPVVAHLLAGRGITTIEEAQRFLNPSLSDLHSPYFLLDLDRTAKRIQQYQDSGQTVLVYGHDDVDGITSTLVIVETLRLLGIPAKTFIPNRMSDDYKLSTEVYEQCRNENIPLVIAIDNGITSVDEVAYGNQIGVETIIIDHHICPNPLPPAFAIVNPLRPGCPYPFKKLAAVGLAYKLAQVLLKAPPYQQALETLLELVVLGTVSDKVPLLDENRLFTYFGLQKLAQTQRPGLKYLVEQFHIRPEDISIEKVASRIIPLLTSGRTGDGQHHGYQLLVETDEIEIRKLYALLSQISHQWREESSQATLSAVKRVEQLDLLDEKIIIVVDRNLPISYLGKCAAKLKARFDRPAIVMSYKRDHAVGEARSIEGFDLVAAFRHCEDLLIQYGGHKPAAGFSIPFENISAFQERMFEYADQMLDWEELQPVIEVDAELPVDDITPDLIRWIARFEPLGSGNPVPVFYAENVPYDPVSLPGYAGRSGTVLMRASGSIFEQLLQLPAGGKIDLVFTLDLESPDSPTIEVKDFTEAGADRETLV